MIVNAKGVDSNPMVILPFTSPGSVTSTKCAQMKPGAACSKLKAELQGDRVVSFPCVGKKMTQLQWVGLPLSALPLPLSLPLHPPWP